MHAVVVRVTVTGGDADRRIVTEEVVPRASSAPGFVAGFWTRSGDGTDGLSLVVFETEDQAHLAKQMIEAQVPEPGAATIDGVDVREVVASA